MCVFRTSHGCPACRRTHSCTQLRTCRQLNFWPLATGASFSNLAYMTYIQSKAQYTFTHIFAYLQATKSWTSRYRRLVSKRRTVYTNANIHKQIHAHTHAHTEMKRHMMPINEIFMCFRCNCDRQSKNKYEWFTSEVQ